jgi:hypothetical protein
MANHRPFHLGGKFDVGTTTGHVGSNGNSGWQTGFGYNFGFTLMQFGIQHIMFYLLIFSILLSNSEISTLVVPTNTGRRL